MATKSLFQLPSYLPMNGSPEWQGREAIHEHLNFLQKQSFCLMLKGVFSKYEHIQQINIEEKDYMELGPDIMVFINEKHDDKSTEAKFILASLKPLDISHLIYLGVGVSANRNKIEEAWQFWMGEEDWAKWKALDTEGKLLQQINSPAKNKRKPV